MMQTCATMEPVFISFIFMLFWIGKYLTKYIDTFIEQTKLIVWCLKDT